MASTALAARPLAPLTLTAANPFLAGETVAVSWVAPDEGSFDEMELILSLDGGRTWPIRITKDLSPQATGTTFRVPSFPAEEASVALRAGREGEKESEEILAESAPFQIRAPVLGAGETLLQVRGEWRTVEAMGGHTADGPVVPGFFETPSVSSEAGNGPDADGGAAEDLVAQKTESLSRRPPAAWIRAPRPQSASNRPLLSRRE